MVVVTRRRVPRRWRRWCIGLGWWCIITAGPTVEWPGDGGLPEPDLSDTGGGTVVDNSDLWPALPPPVITQTFPEPMSP